jgi:hypothetical protein
MFVPIVQASRILIISTFIAGLQPNMAKSPCGWSLVWKHHEIEKKPLVQLNKRKNKIIILFNINRIMKIYFKYFLVFCYFIALREQSLYLTCLRKYTKNNLPE